MVDYDLLAEQAEAFCEDTPDEVAAMANLSSLIYYTLDRLNWAGFYRVKGEELILGPFQGKVACIRIAKGSWFPMCMLFRGTSPATAIHSRRLWCRFTGAVK